MAPSRATFVSGMAVMPYPALRTPETSPTILRVEWGGYVVTYTGDTDWANALVAASDNVDMLISECCFYDMPIRLHMNYSTFKANLPRLNAKSDVLTRMSEDVLKHAVEMPERCASDGLVIEL